MSPEHNTGWTDKIKKKHPNSAGFLSHWDFKKADGTNYFTINPYTIPEDWKDLSKPRNVFEVPEVWYGVERAENPDFDELAWHEVDFCKKIWEKYSERDIDLVFEVCCGICPHGSILAREGINIVGMDASGGMIKAVKARAESQNLPIKAYRRDVFQFTIPGKSPDAAILLGNSFPLAREGKLDNRALVSQLRSVGTFLKKGSIYIIDCGELEPPPFVREYSMTQPRNVDIDFARVTLTTRTFPTHLLTLSTTYITGYDVEYPDGRVRLELKGVRSFISAQHLAALVEMSGIFEMEAFHHWGNLNPGLEHGKGPYLAVLRRK